MFLILCGGAFLLLQTELGKQLFSQGQQIPDSQRIIGKWKQQDGSLSLQFFSDGTLVEERLLNNGKGIYQLLPNKRLKLKIEGVIWGYNEATLCYELTESELALTPDSGTGISIRYKKLK